MDLFATPAPVVHVAHAAAHVAPHVITVTKTVLVGVTYMHAIIATVVGTAVGFGLGWYIKGRGFLGVKTDLTNAKNVITTEVATLEKTSAPAA